MVSTITLYYTKGWERLDVFLFFVCAVLLYSNWLECVQYFPSDNSLIAVLNVYTGEI